MAVTTMANVAYFLPSYYDKVFLEALVPVPQAAKYCMRKPLPLHQGNIAYFPRMTATANVPSSYDIASDGTVITPEAIVDEQVSATIVQFGNAKAISDMTEMTAINTVVEETVKNLADQANNLIDKYILSRAYNTGASLVYTAAGVGDATSVGASFGGFILQWVDTSILANTPSAAIASAGDTNNGISATALRKAVKTLKAKNVKPLSDAEGCFAFLCHTNTAMKLLADTAITDLYKYTDPENLKKGIVGRYAGALIVEDNNVLVSAGGSSSANVYFSVLLGHGAMGVTELDGGVKTYTKPAGTAGTADPINQLMTFGWKAQVAAAILNTSAGVIVASNDDQF